MLSSTLFAGAFSCFLRTACWCCCFCCVFPLAVCSAGVPCAEFAILLREDSAQGSCSAPTFGLFQYCSFMILYLVVALLTLVQLTRIVIATRFKCTYWLMVTEHWLVLMVSLLRAFNMLLYYQLYNYVEFKVVSIISGLPSLFTSWIFTLVIFAW